MVDSNTLLSLGFCGWRPFQRGIEKLAPENKGVYVFRSVTSINLKIGSSDIAYIGRAMSDRKGAYHNIRHSLNEYLHPGYSNQTKIRVGQKALAEGWQVSWVLADSPDRIECQLLRRFYSEHGQLPVENKRWPQGCGPDRGII